MAINPIDGQGVVNSPYQIASKYGLGNYLDSLLVRTKTLPQKHAIFIWKDIRMWMLCDNGKVSIELAENPEHIRNFAYVFQVLKEVRQELEKLLIHMCE